jgi:hypothetical protein
MPDDTDVLHTSTQEPLDDEERDLMDPDTWDWDAVGDVRVVGEPGAILLVRFSRDEVAALSHVARAAGMNPITWLYDIALERIAAEQERGGSPSGVLLTVRQSRLAYWHGACA